MGRGTKATRGTSGRIFSALAHANVNVKMIDPGSSELNIIIGVRNHDFDAAIRAIYDIFVTTQILSVKGETEKKMKNILFFLKPKAEIAYTYDYPCDEAGAGDHGMSQIFLCAYFEPLWQIW